MEREPVGCPRYENLVCEDYGKPGFCPMEGVVRWGLHQGNVGYVCFLVQNDGRRMMEEGRLEVVFDSSRTGICTLLYIFGGQKKQYQYGRIYNDRLIFTTNI